MTEQTASPSTFWQGFSRSLGGCLRLLLFALTVVVITAALYYAIPYVYRYVVTPVQNNQVAIIQLQQAQSRLQDDLDGQLADQRERIGQLESDLAAEREARSQLEALLAEQDEHLAAQATVQAELEASLDVQNEAITTLDQGLDTVDATLTRVRRSIEAMAMPEAEITKLQRQTLILQIQQAILKARLHLIENNPGQAQLALEEAQPSVRRLESLTASEEEETLAEIEGQFETTTIAIEEQPFIALQELEILWQLLQAFSDSDR